MLCRVLVCCGIQSRNAGSAHEPLRRTPLETTTATKTEKEKEKKGKEKTRDSDSPDSCWKINQGSTMLSILAALQYLAGGLAGEEEEEYIWQCLTIGGEYRLLTAFSSAWRRIWENYSCY